MKKILILFMLVITLSIITACGKDEGIKEINIVDAPVQNTDVDDIYDDSDFDDLYQDDYDQDDYDQEYDGSDDYDIGDEDYDDSGYVGSEPDDFDLDYDENGRINWLQYNGHTYRYFDEDITWTEARERCIDEGGHLVTLTDEDEADLIYEYFYDRKAWIGAYKFGDVWYWVTHEDWGYTDWDYGEPSNSKGAEWCVHLWTDMRWNDLSDEDVKNVVEGFICEYDEYVDHGDY